MGLVPLSDKKRHRHTGDKALNWSDYKNIEVLSVIKFCLTGKVEATEEGGIRLLV